MEQWSLIREERLALADTLQMLTTEQWETQSLCGAWSVRDVAAHVMVGPTSRPPDVMLAPVKSRGSLDRTQRMLVDDRAGLSTQEVVAVMRDHVESRFSPPTMDWRAVRHRDPPRGHRHSARDPRRPRSRHLADRAGAPRLRRRAPSLHARAAARRPVRRDRRRLVTRAGRRGTGTGRRWRWR